MRFFAFLFSFLFFNVYCQDITAFNTVYNKTFLETSQKDFNKALQIADSLYKISETPILQTKSLMLSATLYDQSGEFEKSLEYALRSEKIIESTDNIIWKAKIYGFLATHYRYVRLLDKSGKYAELGINTIKNIPNEEVKNNMMIMMMQEMAYYEIEYKRYKKSIENILQAETYLEKVKPNAFLSADNERLLGYNYYHLGNIDESFKHYQNALEMSKGFPENFITGLIYNGLALIYLKKNELEKAKQHLDIARRIADESKYLALKNEVYDTSEKYYGLTKNIDDYVETREKHDTIKKTLQNKMQTFVNKSYSKIDRENIEIKKTDSFKSIIILAISLLAIFGIIFFIRYRNKKRNDIENFRQLLKELDQKNTVPVNEIPDEDLSDELPKTEKASDSEETLMVPSGTVRKILEKLKEFEDSHSYSRNNISLSFLATYCETNTKYLSYVINTCKNKDYNNYINDLRINLAIDKLRSDPKYRNYKIAVLAEEVGFSSHNKFSTIFKKTTSLSPSVFIKYLDDEDNKS
jgi:AraC-like DNA-binding protein